MHNVLNVYRKPFSRHEMSERQKSADLKTPGERVSLSSEGRRQAIIQKVSAEIVARIAGCGPRGSLVAIEKLF